MAPKPFAPSDIVLETTSQLCARHPFEDLSEKEVETIAEALKGTPWLSLFSMVSRRCKAAAARVENPAALRRLQVRDVFASVELAKWARASGCPWDASTCAAVAEGGHLEVLQWLRDNECPWDGRTTHYSAAKEGHLDILRWLRANGCPWGRDHFHDGCPCEVAANGGHLEVLKWLVDNDCPWMPSYTCYAAAEGGHLEVLKWLHECGWKFSDELYDDPFVGAAKGGHVEVLEWLMRSTDHEWDDYTCAFAAKEGHLEVLMWLRDNGCPWDRKTCSYAAEGRPPGGPQVVEGQWLRLE